MKEVLRSEVKVEDTWAVSDIFATEQDWEACIQAVEVLVAQLIEYRGKLNNSRNLLEFLQLFEKVQLNLHSIDAYACLLRDQDTTNSHNQALADKSARLEVNVASALSFFDVELLNIELESMERFYQEQPLLMNYNRFISNIQRRRAHTLSEQEEALLASAQEMASVSDHIDTMLTNADIQFASVKDSKGVEYTVSNGLFLTLQQNKDRELRKNVFESFYKTYESFKNTSAACLAGQMKQLKFYSNARKFDSTLEASLHNTNVPVSVYYNLIETVHKNIHILHKYMKLRKKVMNVDELHMYDLYMPMIEGVQSSIDFEQARKDIVNATSVLKKDYTDVIEHAFEHRWIDRYENKGKLSGAYSLGVHVHPFVLMNYHNDLKSEFTLAHELGHAMHSYLSTKHQRTLDRRYVIFVAEVASTCNEALLMNYLRSNTKDVKVQAFLINHFLEQFRTTLYRQTMFAEFELKINQLLADGRALTADTLCELYYDLNKFYYGENVVVDEAIAQEWARIPHFYMNYYVYQYATGFSAAIALSKLILSGDEQAVDAYLNFLSSGCSKSPIDLLKDAGVDMASSQPIEDALELFDSLIDEFDALVEQM